MTLYKSIRASEKPSRAEVKKLFADDERTRGKRLVDVDIRLDQYGSQSDAYCTHFCVYANHYDIYATFA